jgi:guanylate kinase
MQKSNIFIISGPTGCGESTITNAIIKKLPKFTRLITATTRQPRLNEKNGVDYYFFSKQEFKNEIKKGNILEHTYIKNRDTYYGTYKPDLENNLNNGINVIVNPDIVGTIFFKKNYGATTIFIKPESIESLKKRLIGRDPNISQTELKKRLENAENEIKNEEKFYDVTVINEYGKLSKAVEEVTEIIKKHNA